jgi:hypothetical protein
MRAQRFHLPARLTLAGILVSLALPALSTAAQAKNSDVSLSVHLGYQDVVKPGGWMPVTVDAKTTGPGVDGTLEVQESLSSQPGVTGLTIYDQPISLATGASKRVRLYVDVETTGATITARILVDGRVAASQDALPSGSTSALVAVISDQSAAFDEFAAIHPGGIAARVVHLRADEIADSAIPLRAFDILAIDDFATDSLTARQRAAIGDYVDAGGALLIGTGAAWHKTLAGLPASLLPMQPDGTTVVDSSSLGASAVEIATGSLTNGHPWLSQNAYPLLVERPVGAGMVTMATFDWTQQPVAINAHTREVMRQVMARAFFGPGGSAQNFAYGIGGPGFGLGSQPSVASKSSALTSVLGNLPGLDLPSLQLTGALVLLYVLIVGPLNYIVLGALHRRALAWVTVPVIAVVAAAGAYGAGVFTKGRSVQINQVAIIHVQRGWDHAYEEVYTGVIPPSRGDYQANIGGEGLLISPIANTNGFNGGCCAPGSLKVNVASNDVTLPGMTAFSLGGFATESITSAPPLSAHLQLVNGQITGTIENHSRTTFTDAVLIAGDSYQTIPSLKPGSTATVSLTPKAVNAFGQPLYTRIYNSNYYGGGFGPGGPSVTAAQRDQFAKTQILSLLPTGIGFKGITSATSPLLVAWTHDAVQSVTVNGTHPRSTAMSAVALSLSVDQIGAGPLPGGVVVGRIVDVVGDSSGNGPPGMLMLQNGSVTYEFAPVLTAGARLSGASISAVNPYGPKFGGPPGGSSPSVTGQVWDWSRGAWIDLAYQDNGTTAIPDNAIDPGSGMIRLRVSTANSGFLAGTITLSGTVQ